MSISSTISQYAATNPAVAAAVDTQETDAAILTGLQTGDTSTGALIGTVYTQATEDAALLNGINPVTSASTSSTPSLGSNVDIKA